MPALSRKKGTRKANATSFTKGHKRGGRPKGSLNKFSGEVKAAILDGINSAHPDGLGHWVRDLATDGAFSASPE